MSAQHTPGPWHREGNHIVAGNVRVAVVDTPEIHAGVDHAEADANADAIVAVPDMLRTLQLLLGSLEFEQHMHGKKDPKRSTIDFPRAIEMCRAAIAKAGGAS